jgi:hypothetical protein
MSSSHTAGNSVAEMRSELKTLTAQRNQMTARLTAEILGGTHTRARTTTHNARLGRISERIDFYRREIRRAEALALADDLRSTK